MNSPMHEIEEQVLLGTLVESGADWAVEPDSIAEVDARVDALLHAIGRLRAEIEQNSETAQHRMEHLLAWARDTNQALERSVDFLTRKIQDLTRTYDFGRKRSRALPAGTFGYRRTADSIEVVNADAALAWAKEHGLKIVVRERVNASDLLGHVKATGEVPEGVNFKPGADAFFVKPKAERAGADGQDAA